MARYLGPKCKLSRREGTDLFLKSGVKPLESKCKLEVPPGGIKGERRARAVRLRPAAAREAEAAPHVRRARAPVPQLLQEGGGPPGATGETLLQLLEARLDNVVYRMGFAVTRSEARQLVSHGAVTVNGERVNMPSYQCKAGDVDRAAREGAEAGARAAGAADPRADRASRTGSKSTRRSSPACSSRCPSAATSCRTSTRASSSSCIRSNRFTFRNWPGCRKPAR